jgi:RNA polymerase sigma factor (sigma-70 family)
MTIEQLTAEAVRIEFRAKNNRLLAEREALGLNQVDMAKLCGVTLDVYGRAERLGRVPEAMMVKIAALVNVEPQWLFPHWANLFGDAMNRRSYLLLDDEVAQNVVAGADGGVEMKLLKESFATDLNEILTTLTSREEHIIRSYYGIGCEPMTLENLGVHHGLKRERIRQIKEKALRRLRHESRAEVLREYLGKTNDH